MAMRLKTLTDIFGANLVAWFDAQDAATQTVDASNNVTSWTSKGSAPFTVAPVSNSRLPLITNEYFDGRRALKFTNTNPSMSLSGTGVALPTGSSFATTFTMAVSLGTATQKLMMWGPATSQQGRTFGARNGYPDFGSFNQDHTLNASTAPNKMYNGAARLLVQESGGTTTTGASKVWVDGNSTSINGNINYSNTTSQAIIIGTRVATFVAEQFLGGVGELVIVNRTVTTTERQEAEGVMAWRWGRQDDLPSTHPWKTAAPTINDGPTGYTLVAAPAALSVSTPAVALRRGFILPASGGSVAVSGIAADMRRSRRLAADPQSFVLTTKAATLARGFVLSAAAGRVDLTGVAAELRQGRFLRAAKGDFGFTGQPVLIAKTSRSLAIETGSYLVTGRAAQLLFGRTLSAAPGSLALTARSATLGLKRRLAVAAGAVTLTGMPSVLNRIGVRGMAINVGVFSLSAPATSLRYQRRAAVAGASYALTLNAAPLRHHRNLLVETAPFVLGGSAATLTLDRLIVAFTPPSRVRKVPVVSRNGVVAYRSRTALVPL